MKRFLTTIAALLSIHAVYAQGKDAAVRAVDTMEDLMTYATASFEGKLIVDDAFGRKETAFVMYQRGKNDTHVHFTSGDERGQKILRTKTDIYLYYPEAEEVIRLQGAALKESVLGSDFSYEDLTGNKKLTERYNVTNLGEEAVDGKTCVKARLSARTRTEPYAMEVLWIDKESFVLRKTEYYSVSGKLLKTMRILSVERSSGKIVATRSVIVDAMKKNSKTEVLLTKWVLDKPLDTALFSLEELSW